MTDQVLAEGDRWVSMTEAAMLLDCHPQMVARWVQSRNVESRRVGDRLEVLVAKDAPVLSGPVGQGAGAALAAYQRLAGPSIAMARELAQISDDRVAEVRAQLRDSRRALVVMSVAAVVLAAFVVFIVWTCSRQISAAWVAQEAAEEKRMVLAVQLNKANDSAAELAEQATDLHQKLVEARSQVEVLDLEIDRLQHQQQRMADSRNESRGP